MPNAQPPADKKPRPAQPRNLKPSADKVAAVKGGKKPFVLDLSSIKGETQEDTPPRG